MTTITLPTLPAGLTEEIDINSSERGVRTVPGLTVAPGLAIYAAYQRDETPIPRRYKLTHIPSGLNIPTGIHCAAHIQEIVIALVGTGVDWTQNKEALLAEKDRFVEVALSLRHLCDNIHYGCPGDPEPWHIRCNTCDWEYDPEDSDNYSEPPTSAEEARRIADDHECEPWIEIKAPNSSKWRSPSASTDAVPA